MSHEIERPPLNRTLPKVWSIAVLALALDQLSKWLVLDRFDLAAVGIVELIPGVLSFVLAWNTGVNFGLMPAGSPLGRWVLVAIALGVGLGLSWWIRCSRDDLSRLGAGLIIGGGLANALDRITHGAVVDFLNVSAFGFRNPYSFNVADIWVFLGAAILILRSGRTFEDEWKPDAGQ